MLGDQCSACEHLQRQYFDENKQKMIGRCLAFPGGIPETFYFNDTPHDTVVDGQNGDYVFSPFSPELYNQHYENY